jgi:hypothetical protein
MTDKTQPGPLERTVAPGPDSTRGYIAPPDPFAKGYVAPPTSPRRPPARLPRSRRPRLRFRWSALAGRTTSSSF